MSAIVFEGRAFVGRIEKELGDRVLGLTQTLGRRPKLISIYQPDHAPSRIYTRIKEKKADELGIEFEGIPVVISKSGAAANSQVTDIKARIEKLNGNRGVDGVMVQLPLGFGKMDLEIVEGIAPTKDVDCLTSANLELLREGKQRFLPATVKAVLKILTDAVSVTGLNLVNVAIVGNKGMVGRSLAWQLARDSRFITHGMDREDFDMAVLRKADVVIGCTGQAGLLTGNMVKDKVVAIDTGAPSGDFDFDSLFSKASFITPVPGGVGPVTVACLFENLVEGLERGVKERG